MSRAVPNAVFRINGLFLLIGFTWVAYMRFHEPGPQFKLILHSLMFIAFGLFFAAPPGVIIRRFGFSFAFSLRILALLSGVGVLLLLTQREPDSSEFPSWGASSLLAFVVSVVVSVLDLVFARRSAATNRVSNATPTPGNA